MLKQSFGKLPDGTPIDLYTLTSDRAKVRIMTRGAAIVNFIVDGVDIIGGFDTLEGYLVDRSHQGAIVGRVANRIAGARVSVDGKEYALADNDHGNCLHGGPVSYDQKVWRVIEAKDDSLTLGYLSPDGEQGFPANLDVRVQYRLLDRKLMMHYEAKPDGKTPIAITNHSYFNLDGTGGLILDHTAKIYADTYSAVNEKLIPTGEHPEVTGTPYYFTEPKKIGAEIDLVGAGYDNNYNLRRNVRETVMGYELVLAAEVSNGVRTMKVYTDQPGVQFYTANFLSGEPAMRGGFPKTPHSFFCLETQTEPDCVSHGIGFYGKGEVYRHTTVYEITDAEAGR